MRIQPPGRAVAFSVSLLLVVVLIGGVLMVAEVVALGEGTLPHQESCPPGEALVPADGVHELEHDGRSLISRVRGTGWIASLLVVVEQGSITEIVYNEKQRVGDELRLKSQDEDYAARWAAATGGMNQHIAFPRLTASFLQGGLAEVDAVSGASSSTKRFNAVARKIPQACSEPFP